MRRQFASRQRAAARRFVRQQRRRRGRRDRAGIGERRHAAEHRHVVAERQIDHDRIVLAAVLVVTGKRAAQAHRLDAHDRIGLRIEIVGAPERLDRDGVALDAVGRAAQRRLDDVAQERDELRRAAECFACRHTLERSADFIRTRTAVSLRFNPRHALPLPSIRPGIESSILMIVRRNRCAFNGYACSPAILRMQPYKNDEVPYNFKSAKSACPISRCSASTICGEAAAGCGNWSVHVGTAPGRARVACRTHSAPAAGLV